MDRSSSDVQAPSGTVASPAPEPASLWEDFLDILYEPSAVFARREKGNFWIPMLVVTIALGALFLANGRVMDPIIDAETQRGMAAAMEQNPQITPEMVDQMRGVSGTIMKVSMFLTIPIVLFVIGVVLYLVGKLFGAQQTFRAALVVAAYAYVPKIIEAVLAGVQGFFVDPAQLDGRFRLTLGIGRFLDPDTTSPMLVGLLGRVDVFTIWVTVLLAIGLAVTGRISRGRAALAGLVIWVVGALPSLYSGVGQ